MSTTRNKKGETVISLRITSALDSKVKKAAAKTNLRRSDVLRLAVDRGIDRLLEQLISDATV